MQALNGVYTLEIPRIEVLDLGSTVDGYVYVCGQEVDSGEGWIGRFGPDGEIMRGWEFPDPVTGLVAISSTAVFALLEGGQGVMIRYSDPVWTTDALATQGLVRDDGIIVLARYDSSTQSIRLLGLDQDSTTLWESNEPVASSSFSMTSDYFNHTVLLVYKDRLGQPEPFLTLLIVEPDGSSIDQLELANPGFVTLDGGVARTDDGTWVLAGTVLEEEEDQLLVAEYSASGELLWSHLHIHSSSSRAEAIDEAGDGTLVVLGSHAAYQETNSHFVQLQFNTDRDLDAERSYGMMDSENHFHEMILMNDLRMQLLAETGDGDYYIIRDDL